jgi:hypothetical protein
MLGICHAVLRQITAHEVPICGLWHTLTHPTRTAIGKYVHKRFLTVVRTGTHDKDNVYMKYTYLVF